MAQDGQRTDTRYQVSSGILPDSGAMVVEVIDFKTSERKVMSVVDALGLASLLTQASAAVLAQAQREAMERAKVPKLYVPK